MSNEAHFETVQKTIEDAPSMVPGDLHTNGKAEESEETPNESLLDRIAREVKDVNEGGNQLHFPFREDARQTEDSEAYLSHIQKGVAKPIRSGHSASSDGEAEVPGGRFTMGPKGLTVTQGKGKTAWIAAPFKIIGRVRDSQSEGWGLLLEWKDADKKLHRVQVADAELHADTSALCGKLASQGLKITTGQHRKFLLQYLNESAVEKRINSFPRTGWNEIDGKMEFVLPGQDDVIVAGEAVSPYEQAGTLEDWRNSVGRLVAGHSRPMFAVATAFAAPLLKLLNGEGGGFNFRGSSSIGKTTALRAAASVWGRADEHGIIRTWRGTANGIEGTAALFSDTLLPLDELGVASGQEVGNIVYSLASGVGKQRAQRDGSARPPRFWRVMILSTGELGIADKIQEGGKRVRAGQEIRILDIDANAGKGSGIFDRGDGAEIAEAIKLAAANTSYGTAGSAFVKAIKDHGLKNVTEDLDATHKALIARLTEGVQDAQAKRAAQRFALVGAAGELAIQLGVLPWEAGTVATATEEIFRAWHLDRGNDPGEVRNALAQIRKLLEQHGDSRFDAASRTGDKLAVRDRLGWVRSEGNSRQWLVPPETWKAVFCDGFDAKAIAHALAEREMLLRDHEDKTSRSETINGKKERVYVLTAKIMDNQ